MDTGKEPIETEGCKFLLHTFLASIYSYVIEFQTKEAYSSFDLSRIEYNICRQFMEENENVTLRIKLGNLIH
jgi:hypothetical protein